MKQKLSIIKIGGNVIENEGEAQQIPGFLFRHRSPKNFWCMRWQTGDPIAEKLGIEFQIGFRKEDVLPMKRD